MTIAIIWNIVLAIIALVGFGILTVAVVLFFVYRKLNKAVKGKWDVKNSRLS